MAYRPKNRVFAPAALTSACVTTTELRDHFRVTSPDEDAQIGAMALAAHRIVERRTQRLLSRRSATLSLPGLPGGTCPVELPGGEVGSITSVTVDGVAVTGSTFIGDSPALLLPATDWPTVAGTGYPVVIVYQVGFTSAPEDLKAAVKLLAAELYERRSNADAESVSEVPLSAQYLMDPWRIRPI